MLVLCLTTFAVALFVGPELLSRWVLGWVIPRRNLSQNRGEELTSAVLHAMVPLLLTAFWLDHRHVLGLWGGWRDVRLVTAGLQSTAAFDRYQEEFFVSSLRVCGMVWSLLWRLYLLEFLLSGAFAFTIQNYRRLRRKISSPFWAGLLAQLILPRISEWHVVLSERFLPKEDVFVCVDVLVKNGTLYQGRVQDRTLTSDGTLAMLTLREPKRFARDQFHLARAADATVGIELFWRNIPSELFVIMGSDITNVNVRYLAKLDEHRLQKDLTGEEVQALRDLLAKLRQPTGG